MINTNILLHLKSGNKVFTKEELIQNALDQEKSGVKPSYALYNHGSKKVISPKGWLIYSTWEDGACIAVRKNKDEIVLLHGWQADFCFC